MARAGRGVSPEPLKARREINHPFLVVRCTHLVHELKVVRLLEGSLLKVLEQLAQRLDAVELDKLLHPHHRLLPDEHRERLQILDRRLDVHHVDPVLRLLADVASSDDERLP